MQNKACSVSRCCKYGYTVNRKRERIAPLFRGRRRGKNKMIKVKFCGLRRVEDIEAVNRLQPDYAGFVFARSRRQVTAEQVSAFRKLLNKEVKTVAVLVNMPVEEAASLANAGLADLLQLHGDESAAYIAKLKTLTEAKVIKAIRLQPEQENAVRSNAKVPQCNVRLFERGSEHETARQTKLNLLAQARLADYYLFDTFAPDVYGGTGKTFSLSLLKGLPIDKPFFLAGGLDAENVAAIIQEVQADEKLRTNFYGVDVSGGIETEGVKDEVKMEAFMKVMHREK